MKYLLKDSLKPFYHYLKNKNQARIIYQLFDKWGGGERYKEAKNIKFLDFCQMNNLFFIVISLNQDFKI